MNAVALHLYEEPKLTLARALLVYTSGRAHYVTSHAVEQDPKKGCRLKAGVPLAPQDLKDLVSWAMDKSSMAGWVHERLVFSAPGMLAWWRPAQIDTMFFNTKEHGGLPGEKSGRAPQPPLVFATNGRNWFVWALQHDARPTANTPLFVAPYMNVWEAGSICVGNMPVPDRIDIAAIDQFERGFFQSRFTHANVKRLVKFKGGAGALWLDLLTRCPETFPHTTLLSARETLEQALNRITKDPS